MSHIRHIAAEATSKKDAMRQAKEKGLCQAEAARMYDAICAERTNRIRTRREMVLKSKAIIEKTFPWRNLKFRDTAREMLINGVIHSVPAHSKFRLIVAAEIAKAAALKDCRVEYRSITEGSELHLYLKDKRHSYYLKEQKVTIIYRVVDIVLPILWLKRGMRVMDIDGKSTFMPRRPDHVVGGIELRRCWIISSKGARRSVLASLGDLHYHAKSVRKAVAGLCRKAAKAEKAGQPVTATTLA